MAVSFNKEVILEAIQEVLAEDQAVPVRVKSKKPGDQGSVEVMTKDKMNALKRTGKVEVEPMEEDHHENPNDDSNMAKSQLYAIAKYAIELLQLIKDGDQLDAWVQAKITKAADYVDAVQHYLEGEKYLDSNQEESEEELDEDYVPRTKEDLVFQYLRDAWQFGALKGKHVDPDEELSTMADSLLANLPDYDAAELSELFGRAKNKMVNYQGHDYEILDIDSAGTFTLIDPKHKFYVNKNQMKQGRVPDVKEPEVEDVPLMNLKEDDVAAPVAGFEDDSAKAPKGDKRLNKAASKNDKIISTYKKIKPLFKKAAAGDKEALAIVKANQDVIKAYKKLTQTHLAENKATCCGKCGRTHVKGTECKKPFLTGKDHCRVR